jgi:beta-glucanase (GH16 family)
MTTYQTQWEHHFNASDAQQSPFEDFTFDLGDGSTHGIPGWGNQEREYYIESAAAIDDASNLVITANRMPVITAENPSGAVSAANPYQAYYGTAAEWTSAKLTTFNKIAFHYGRMEARIKAPAGLGTWPAFWMLGTDIRNITWPQCGEIDIMEGRGDLPSTLFGTLHGPGYFGDHGKGKVIDTEVNLSEEFHTYAIEWLPNQISWFFDDTMYAHNTAEEIAPLEWVYNKPFYLIVNLAMGGHFTGPIAEDLKQAQMKIDYIRHSSINGVGEIIRGTTPFES